MMEENTQYEGIVDNAEEMQKFNNVAEHYLKSLLENDTKLRDTVEKYFVENLDEASDCLENSRIDGYYGENYDDVIAKSLALLEEISEKIKDDDDLKSLVDKVHSLLKKALDESEIKYYPYYEQYKQRYSSYPYYYYKKKSPKEIEQEEVQKYITDLAKREHDKLRSQIRENLVPDLIAKGMGGFGSNLVKSTAEQREWYEKASNVDNMLQGLCKEIKEDIETTKQYNEKLKELEREEKELSGKEEDWKKKKSQLVDLAVKAILEGGI